MAKTSITLLADPHVTPDGLKFVGWVDGHTRKKVYSDLSCSRMHKQHFRIYGTDAVHPAIFSQELSGRYLVMVEL